MLIFRINIHNQRLLFRGRQLKDADQLRFYGIKAGCEVYLIPSLRGGGSSQLELLHPMERLEADCQIPLRHNRGTWLSTKLPIYSAILSKILLTRLKGQPQTLVIHNASNIYKLWATEARKDLRKYGKLCFNSQQAMKRWTMSLETMFIDCDNVVYSVNAHEIYAALHFCGPVTGELMMASLAFLWGINVKEWTTEVEEKKSLVFYNR